MAGLPKIFDLSPQPAFRILDATCRKQLGSIGGSGKKLENPIRWDLRNIWKWWRLPFRYFTSLRLSDHPHLASSILEFEMIWFASLVFQSDTGGCNIKESRWLCKHWTAVFFWVPKGVIRKVLLQSPTACVELVVVTAMPNWIEFYHLWGAPAASGSVLCPCDKVPESSKCGGIDGCFQK